MEDLALIWPRKIRFLGLFCPISTLASEALFARPEMGGSPKRPQRKKTHKKKTWQTLKTQHGFSKLIYYKFNFLDSTQTFPVFHQVLFKSDKLCKPTDPGFAFLHGEGSLLVSLSRTYFTFGHFLIARVIVVQIVWLFLAE